MHDSPETLRTNIANTRRDQKWLAVGCVVCAAAAVILWSYEPLWGKVGIAIAIATLAIGYYITAMHIADWRDQLAAWARQDRDSMRQDDAPESDSSPAV